MFRPHIPVNPLPTGIVTPAVHPTSTADVEHRPDSSPTTAGHHSPASPSRTTIQLTPGSAVALAAGGGAVVLVVGAVLVSMLLAVAITGMSVAVIAVVMRLLVKDLQKGR